MFTTNVKSAAVALVAGLVGAAAGHGTSDKPPQTKAEQTRPASKDVREENQHKTGKPRTDLLGDPLPAGASARLGTTRLRHGHPVAYVGFSPDGKTLISADWYRVIVWETATGRPLRQLGVPGTSLQSIAVSDDGRTMALAGRDGEIVICDPATGQRLRQFQAAGRFPSVVLSSDGRTLALLHHGQKDGQQLLLWDAVTGKELHRLAGHSDTVHGVAFSRDGKTLVSSGDDRTIRFWDTTGKEIRQIKHDKLLGGPVLAPDGKTVASVELTKRTFDNGLSGATLWTPGKSVLLWDVPSGKETHRLEHGERLSGQFAFSPNGKSLVSSDAMATRLWDVATGKELNRLRFPPAHHVAFTSDGKMLATESSGAIRLWNLATGKEALPLAGHHGGVIAPAVSPDGRTFATAGYDPVIRLWDAATGKVSRQLAGHERQVNSLVFGRDGSTLLSSSSDDTTRLWELATGQELQRFWGTNGVLSADGKTVITGTDGKTIRVWDVSTGKELRNWEGLENGWGWFHLGLAPDGRTAFSFSSDKTVRLWNVATGKELRHFLVPPFREDDRIYCMAFSPDGKSVAFGGQVRYAVIYDLATGAESKRLTGLPESLSSLTFSRDSRILATGDWTSGTARLWEVATGQSFQQFAGHQGRAFRMAFSLDSSVLLTANEDTTALVWDLTGRYTNPPANPLSAKDLEARWADLAASNAARAQQAVRTLALAPEQAVPFLATHLQPVPVVDPNRMASLIADLASDSFTVRDRANQELEKLGEAAEPGVHKALAGKHALEARQRLKRLLENLQQDQRLRALRTLQILELIGTAEAWRVLQSLARGAPGAWLTKEAKETLGRLRS